MSVGYIIISLGTERRKSLTQVSHRRLREAGLSHVTGVEFIDGKTADLDAELAGSGYRLANNGNGFHKGEIGLWLSTINCLKAIVDGEHEHVIVLEDDAVVKYPMFKSVFPSVMKEIPDDYDFFAWAVPQNQRQDYFYNRIFDEDGNWQMILGLPPITKEESPHYIPGKRLVCEAYQGYRAVAMMYSKAGAGRILDLINKQGIYGPTDIVLFTAHHTGKLKGYTLLPDVRDIIDHMETGTTVRSTGMYR